MRNPRAMPRPYMMLLTYFGGGPFPSAAAMRRFPLSPERNQLATAFSRVAPFAEALFPEALFPEALPRVAPPRPRSVTPVSLSSRWMKPYERPVALASALMDSPELYLVFRSLASSLRSEPVTLVPFRRASATCTSRKVEHPLRYTPTAMITYRSVVGHPHDGIS